MAKQFADPQIIVDTKLHVRYIDPGGRLGPQIFETGRESIFYCLRDSGTAGHGTREHVGRRIDRRDR